jgi:hypothetical protein
LLKPRLRTLFSHAYTAGEEIGYRIARFNGTMYSTRHDGLQGLLFPRKYNMDFANRPQLRTGLDQYVIADDTAEHCFLFRRSRSRDDRRISRHCRRLPNPAKRCRRRYANYA